MNCPVCENLLNTPTCEQCQTSFSDSDYAKLRQFAYLLQVTDDWTPDNMVARRRRYVEAYEHFRQQWKIAHESSPADELPVKHPPAIESVSKSAEIVTVPQSADPPSIDTDPPFEQWLFSERTIRSALYSGAFLLILSGLIFVGANWSRLPGLGKLAVTLATTALMCGAGFVLLRRSTTLRIGGLALIGIAAGFAPLNFYVVDTYLVDMDESTIFLLGSLTCTLFYVWLVWQTRSTLLTTFLSIGILSTQIAVYVILNAEGTVMAALLMLWPAPLLWIALHWRDRPFLFRPNFIIAHLLAGLIYCILLVTVLLTDLSAADVWYESHWWVAIGVLIGCAFYIVNFRVLQSRGSEIIAAGAFAGASITLTTYLVDIYFVEGGAASQESIPLSMATATMMGLYLAIGFATPRYRLWLHGTGILFSWLAIYWAWDMPIIATAILLVVAVAYLIAAVLYRRVWLLVPTLLAVYWSVWTFWQIDEQMTATALIISYAVLGVVLMGIGRWVRQRHTFASILLMSVSGVTLLLMFGVSFGADDQWLPVSLSLVAAAVAVMLTWLERAWLLSTLPDKDEQAIAFPGVLSLIAALVLFAGHFNLMAALSDSDDGMWPLITIAVCVGYVALSWILRRDPLHQLYGVPLRLAGFATMVVPLSGALAFDQWVLAIVLAAIGVMLIADSRFPTVFIAQRYQILLGVGFLLGTYWAILAQYAIEETQWYVLPLGTTLLIVGWLERQHGSSKLYLPFTMLGLLILFSSALFQSFDAIEYAVLLLVESVLAIGIGVRIYSRAYVQLGLLALLANGLVQYGPAFANLPRFVQIGVVGSTLLILGMLALFRREQLLTARNALREQWREWNV